MSRGHGALQRRALAVLDDDEPRPLRDIAGIVYGDHPTDSQIRGLRRALAGLVTSGDLRRGYVEDDLECKHCGGTGYEPYPPGQTVYRVP